MTTAPDTKPSRPVWRSLLYVPVNVEKYVAKAHTRGADAIQLDLEDSVPVSEKANARKLVQEAAETVSQAGADVVVRINQPLRMAVRDLEETVSPLVHAITLTKVDSASHVKLLAEMVDELEAERGMTPGHTRFITLVESADAFFRLEEIAKSHPRVAALGLGGEDFATSVGTVPDPDVMLYPKQQSIIASRAAGIMPLGIIGTVADYSDVDGMRAIIRNSRRFGFEGASCIHPSIVSILNRKRSGGSATHDPGLRGRGGRRPGLAGDRRQDGRLPRGLPRSATAGPGYCDPSARSADEGLAVAPHRVAPFQVPLRHRVDFRIGHRDAFEVTQRLAKFPLVEQRVAEVVEQCGAFRLFQ
jgi:citrate lyase subunit beta/citryl-CoA lyase